MEGFCTLVYLWMWRYVFLSALLYYFAYTYTAIGRFPRLVSTAFARWIRNEYAEIEYMYALCSLHGGSSWSRYCRGYNRGLKRYYIVADTSLYHRECTYRFEETSIRWLFKYRTVSYYTRIQSKDLPSKARRRYFPYSVLIVNLIF